MMWCPSLPAPPLLSREAVELLTRSHPPAQPHLWPQLDSPEAGSLLQGAKLPTPDVRCLHPSQCPKPHLCSWLISKGRGLHCPPLPTLTP